MKRHISNKVILFNTLDKTGRCNGMFPCGDECLHVSTPSLSSS